jgi:hypothetical protein
MPRRNNCRRTRRAARFLELPERALTTEGMARRLVTLGLASPMILDRAPRPMPAEVEHKTSSMSRERHHLPGVSPSSLPDWSEGRERGLSSPFSREDRPAPIDVPTNHPTERNRP